tara:strand:- start:207 stop:542 length:336 start_codon:yes stop_codon:yes gene_type:complete
MSDKIYIKLTHNADKQPGDNRPSFVAPINPKSPEGKTWRIGVKIGENWYNQAGFDDMDEQGNPTGIINVVLSPSNTGPSTAKPSGQQQSYAPNNKFAKGQGSAYNKTNYNY